MPASANLKPLARSFRTCELATEMFKEVIVFDTEFTAWAGSMERKWQGPGEFREIVQIGAVCIDAKSFAERASFQVLIRPVLNPVLSDYFVALTRITNERVAEEGLDFEAGIAKFADFIGKRAMFCYGRDDLIIARNSERLGKAMCWPHTNATNLRDWLTDVGVKLSGVSSGQLAKHVGSVSQGMIHDALVDARSLAEAVRYLVKNGAPNPYPR